MARNNPFTDVILEIAEDFRTLKDSAPKSPPPPVGKEEVNKQEFMRRFQQMAPAQRQQVLQEPGARDTILEMLKESNNA